MEKETHEFGYKGSDFLLDGKPILMCSGEMHYQRIPRDYWRQRLQMAKAMGLNTVAIYMFWNGHEPQPGQFDFSGRNDVKEFVKTMLSGSPTFDLQLKMKHKSGKSIAIEINAGIMDYESRIADLIYS